MRADRRLALLGLAVAAAVGLASRVRADCECDPRPLDVVFCIDSTGSMTGAIDGVKHRIQRLLELLRENTPKVRFGIVTYRDVGDEYLRRGLELTDDGPRIAEYLKGIVANGGGDTPEAVEAGLEMSYADKHMHWDERAKKVLILVADAPAHDDKKALCLQLATDAKKRGITTFTISCDGNVPGFKELAAAGGGKNVDIGRSDDVARMVLALALDRDEQAFQDAFGPPPGAPGAADASKAPRSWKNGLPQGASAFVFQQLEHEGDWDPPHHHGRLLRALHDRVGIDVAAERRVVKLSDETFMKEPFLYITGHGELRLSPDEEGRLRRYVERGGTILIERCCDGEGFDASARALARRVASTDLVACGPDHPVYRSGGEIGELDHVVGHASGQYVKKRPLLYEAASPTGRPLVLYSPLDLGCGWSGTESGKSCALREGDALKWTVNILLYVLST